MTPSASIFPRLTRASLDSSAADDDPTRLLPCDACDCKQHSYCIEPPLEELPLQTVRVGRGGFWWPMREMKGEHQRLLFRASCPTLMLFEFRV